MTRLSLGGLAALILSVSLALIVAGAASGPVHFGPRPGLASCYPRPHVRSHERQPLTAVRVALVRGFWEVARLPVCGVTPLAQTVAAWERQWLGRNP